MPIPQIDRTALRAAFAVVDAAKQKVATAHQQVARAQEATGAARDAYQAARLKTEEIKQRSISTFRANPLSVVPAETAASLKQLRADAEAEEASSLDELTHLETAVSAAMAQELADAERVLTNAERLPGEAAAAVVTLAATAVVEEVHLLLARTKYLREVLRGASNGSGEQHIRQAFFNLVASGIDEPQEPRLMWPSPMPASTTYWANLVRALNADPDAPIPEMPGPAELGCK